MLRIVCSLSLLLAVTLPLPGCGCGDRPAYRSLELWQYRGDQAWAGYLIEVSPALVAERTDRKDDCGNPITEIKLEANKPVKVMIVPATQP